MASKVEELIGKSCAVRCRTPDEFAYIAQFDTHPKRNLDPNLWYSNREDTWIWLSSLCFTYSHRRDIHKDPSNRGMAELCHQPRIVREARDLMEE